MSWEEYSDMFDKAQSTGKYKCFIFDMKNSRSGYNVNKVEELVAKFKEKIKPEAIHKLPKYDNPFRVLGDLIVLVIYRDSLSDEEVYDAFKKSKYEVGLDRECHYFSGYYETDNWAEGGELYYFGYCVQELEHRSKQRPDLL
jgi:hypothetical protein